MKSCFFVGHRDAPERIMPLLQEAVERHIAEYGVTEFIVGNYGAFDRMAARAVIRAKERYPGIILLMLLPYHPAERPTEAPPGFDSTYYPPCLERTPRRYAIIRANRYIVDHTDYLISYAWQSGSNAKKLVEYATSRATKGLIMIENLASSLYCL